MKSLIRYWNAKLQSNLWLMSQEDRAMVRETISALRELQRIRKEDQVQREADLVRTAVQLREETVSRRET